MKHFYEAPAYDSHRWPDSHWRADAAPPPAYPALEEEARCDVAIIGGGYAGLNAALEFARHQNRAAIVLEAGQPGWGASGRNGGFCCLGGAGLSDAQIVARVGISGARDFRDYQHEAVEWVGGLLTELGIPARQGPAGECCLAHSPQAFAALAEAAKARAGLYGESHELIAPDGLAERGLAGPGFHGAVVIPQGFALQPLTYAAGLAARASAAGSRIFGQSAVRTLRRESGGWRLETGRGVVWARQVLIATNGYSAEDLPAWLGGRLLPVFSAILVTRPLTASESRAQGFTSPLMSYDSRRLLHYFRYLPDGRFLFGARGGHSARPEAQAAAQARLRNHFARLFPAWAEVAIEHSWSGLVCLTESRAPYLGPVPGAEGLFAALGWHGNGVALASLSGRRAALLMAGRKAAVPALMRRPPRRFRPAPLRRAALALGAFYYGFKDGPLP